MAKSVTQIQALVIFALCVCAVQNLPAQGGAASPVSTARSVSARTPAGTDSTAVRETIANVYAAFSAGDVQRYRALLTDDYALLENGELLDVEGDVGMMPTADSSYQRTDAFDFRSVKIHEDVAYAVYFLKSAIKDRKGSRNREWLESAVLLRSGTAWRLALLHSTRITKSGG